MMQRKILVILSIVLLQACGFHLRGAYEMPKDLKIVRISPYQPYDPLQRALRTMLAGNGVQIVEGTTEDAPPSTLSIVRQDFEERPIAYGVDGRVARARLTLTLEYAVDLQPSHASYRNTLQVSREYNLDPRNILGTEQESTRLKEDLYEEAASQWISELSTHKPSDTDPKRDPLSPCGTRSVGPADKGSRAAGGEGTPSTVSPLIRHCVPPSPSRGEGKTITGLCE